MTTQRSPGFQGRASERQTLHRLLDTVRGGASAVLVVRGDAGVGKTALLRHCSQQAAGCLVVQVTAVQSEMELAYAGVHQLCSPLLGGLDRLRSWVSWPAAWEPSPPPCCSRPARRARRTGSPDCPA